MMSSVGEFEHHLAVRHGSLGLRHRRHGRGRLASIGRWLYEAWYSVPIIAGAIPGILAFWIYAEIVDFERYGRSTPGAGYFTFALISTAAFWALRNTRPPRH
jgi:hypothetical protein